VQTQNGLFERFEETTTEIAFDLLDVRKALIQAGFRSVHMALPADLNAPVEDPERESRIFIIAGK
jgi:hypothetical protein